MSEMENKEQGHNQNEVFSESVRAGKRTYFFDVKTTRKGERYLNITESIRKFSDEQAKFYYEKHRIFLYQEDFEKFSDGLKRVFDFVNNNEEPPVEEDHVEGTDIEFEDLGKENTEE